MSNFLNVFCNTENSLSITRAEASVYIFSYLTSYLQSTLLFVFIFQSFNKYNFQAVS